MAKKSTAVAKGKKSAVSKPKSKLKPKRKPKKLVSMARNPQDNWTIKDIETVCRALEIECQAPSGGGSHYKIFAPEIVGPLTIPARKPIKAFYIKAFVTKCEAQWEYLTSKEAENG